MKQLKESFRDGLNNGEACLDANISEKTFYTVISKNKKLKKYFQLLQKNVSKIAKQNIVREIKDKNDIELSKWWSERKNKEEFSTKQELDHKGDLKVLFDDAFKPTRQTEESGTEPSEMESD